ncbi:3-methyl-2-oxobutanoate hydroxymethyltransferase [Clostridium formicaceticum]|uniref:3-methyl-2-oxobutanoate hydroxymethyltransferase n=1 Tax=Clostridium formicaceticum TaxID=1497 RepID=A0A1D9FHT7_9CLOT|nr:3-methyl-2-oxobutanoate hydroxymethyltransferase [Clostridium formicaceticum]AOY74969.1 3-methyl-2-oxobutanoate hydroxymethyltransferase [Clostridium formicaceticum]AOY75866.1 3-methyl-2-oxobutanoate hydroxymethyltransferase [Clostridium formicaceticum]ARE86206.1 3-methyl-2-oxobutanoate hydroxymethyltransferase [Clostridium formicaceticum]ARE89381.1 3-methyl-2-oxobutanoate hydroxymethyltransferase [Clostridium formicaceticum]
MAKKSIHDFHKMVAEGEKITYLTAYDYLTAKMMEKAGVEMLLVGDSLGMVSLGYDTTLPVTLEDMIHHCKAVRRGAPDTFIVGDMTYMSYQISNQQAVENAGRLIKEGGCDAVKLEGGGPEIAGRIKAINDAGILVMGHIGLTPQFMGQQGGYKAQGKSAQAAVNIVNEAKRIEEAGAFSILVEGVPAPVGKAITERSGIPILGIGAGSYTHGQLLIYADMIGLYDNFTPKFVKQYANVNEIMTNAFKEYYKEVKEKNFPIDGEHTYNMKAEEEKEFLNLLEKNA